MKTILQKNSDKIGIISSSLCLIHCIALPIFISLQPTLIGFLEHDLHFIEYIFLVLSYVAVYFSTRSHHVTKEIKFTFYVVLSVFTVGILFEETLGWIKYVGYVGSLGLISLHIFNIYHCKRCAIAEKLEVES